MHCSIVILYNPVFSEISVFLNELIKSKFFLIIFDNSEKKLTKDFNIYLDDKNVLYLNLKKNMGIAFAQNVGIKEATSRNFETITLFDQDSFINSENYRKYIQTFHNSKYNIIAYWKISLKLPIYINPKTRIANRYI